MLRVYSTLEILHARQRRKKERKKGENKLHSVPTTTTQLQRRRTNRGNLKARKEAKNTEIIQGI
jgi:hypothetical protein